MLKEEKQKFTEKPKEEKRDPPKEETKAKEAEKEKDKPVEEKPEIKKNYWIALANPESSDFSKIRGYLRISASVLHESDERVELSCTSGGSIALPPQIKAQYFQLKVQIFKAKGVPDMDSLFVDKSKKECNGYITALYMGTKVKTSVVDMKDDKDTTSADDVIGFFELSVNDVLNNKYDTFRYVNIYGAPLGVSGKMTDKMNENSERVSLWNGKILIRASAEKTNFPKVCSEKLSSTLPIFKELGAIREKILWSFELFLPTDSDQYMINIKVEDQEISFASKKAVHLE